MNIVTALNKLLLFFFKYCYLNIGFLGNGEDITLNMNKENRDTLTRKIFSLFDGSGINMSSAIIIVLLLGSICLTSRFMTIFFFLLTLSAQAAVLVCIGCILLRVVFHFIKLHQQRPQQDHQQVKPISLGFFHPYCNSGGGGERVLWLMIASLLSSPDIAPRINIVIYTGGDESSQAIIHNVRHYYSHCM